MELVLFGVVVPELVGVWVLVVLEDFGGAVLVPAGVWEDILVGIGQPTLKKHAKP